MTIVLRSLRDQLATGLVKGKAGVAQETDDGKQSHVAARAEMKTLSDEISRLVGMLDGFNRYRFHLDPELIVAWESAKHVVTGPQPKETVATTPVTPGLEPAA